MWIQNIVHVKNPSAYCHNEEFRGLKLFHLLEVKNLTFKSCHEGGVKIEELMIGKVRKGRDNINPRVPFIRYLLSLVRLTNTR